MSRMLLCVLLVGCVPFSSPVVAQDAAEDKAIERGVKYLRSLQQADGSWPHPQRVGMTSLAALTLLECKVPANDPGIESALKYVRNEAVGATNTYSLALALVLLHKIDQARDVPLAQSLGVRILAGQNLYGSWGVECPGPSLQEVLRLRKLLETDAGKDDKASAETRQKLAPEARQELELLQMQAKRILNASHFGDTSSTSSALLGLEIARQYGLPVESAMRQAELRLSQTQRQDSGWSQYMGPSVLSGNLPAPVQATQQVAVFEKYKKTTKVVHTDPIIFDHIHKFGLEPFFWPELTKRWVGPHSKAVAAFAVWAKDGNYLRDSNTPNDYYPPSVYYLRTSGKSYRTITDQFGRSRVVPMELYSSGMGQLTEVPPQLKAFPPPSFPRVNWTPFPIGPGTDKKTLALAMWWQERVNKWWPCSLVVFRSTVAFDFVERESAVVLGVNAPTHHPLPKDIGTSRFIPIANPAGGTSQVSLMSSSVVTCEALFGLAICRANLPVPMPAPGVALEMAHLLRKNATDNALLSLANLVGYPVGEQKHHLLPKYPPTDPIFYSLLALSNMNNAYGLTSLGQKNWHAWGSELLIVNQKQDGGWLGAFQIGGADTCHALLFLRQANWVPKVTERLKNEVTDPALDKQRQTTETYGEKEADWLVKELGQRNAAAQEALLKQVQKAPADVTSHALALAVGKVGVKLQNKVRQTLTDRLAMSKSDELTALLSAPEAELRRAACNACHAQKSKTHIPFLIPMLDDADEGVTTAAHRALKTLSGQDFGPSRDVNEANRIAAIRAWRDWWESEGAKK